ncbi:MAG: hypothetical protein AAB962_01590 [Patescibacteria group bacterium]
MKEEKGVSWKVLVFVFGIAFLALLVLVFRNDLASSVGKIENASKIFSAVFTKDFLWLTAKIFALLLGAGIWAYIAAGYGIFFSFVKKRN